jgi:hypothetical protein
MEQENQRFQIIAGQSKPSTGMFLPQRSASLLICLSAFINHRHATMEEASKVWRELE